MRIIHIVHGNSMGGAQRYALDICRHYVEAGSDVVALTRDARPSTHSLPRPECHYATPRCATTPTYSPLSPCGL